MSLFVRGLKLLRGKSESLREFLCDISARGLHRSFHCRKFLLLPFVGALSFGVSHFLYSPSKNTRRISRHVHTFTLLCFVRSLRYVAHDIPPCKHFLFCYNVAPLQENLCSILPELSQKYSVPFAGNFHGLDFSLQRICKGMCDFRDKQALVLHAKCRAFTLNHGGRS